MLSCLGFTCLPICPSVYPSVHHLAIHLSIHPTPYRSTHSPPPVPAAMNPLPISVDLPVLDIAYQWNQTLCVLLCLHLSLNVVCSGSIRGVACIRGLHSFSWLRNIPLHRILLIRPTLYGHLSCFLLSVLVSSAATIMGKTPFS